MISLEKQAIKTVAGDYAVEWFYEEGADQPYDEGFRLFVHGRREYIDVDETKGELPSLVENAILTSGKYREDSWDWELRSGAAVVRYMRLKGFKGVTLVDERYRPVVPSANRREHVIGIAWAPEDATDPDEYVKVALSEWHAWGEGDTFGWVLTDPSGDEVSSCWGYYGFWESNGEREYTLALATDEAQSDAASRVKQANSVGAGIVGVI